MFSISGGLDRFELLPNLLVNSSVKKIGSNFMTYSFDYSINTLDTKHFPKRGGVSFLTAGTSLPIAVYTNSGTVKSKYTRSDPGEYSFNRFYTFQIGFRHYFPLGKKLTFGFSADGLIITDTLSTQNNFFLLGGTEPKGMRSVAMTGYYANEIATKKYAGLGAEVDYEIFKNVHINLMTSTFMIEELGGGNAFSLFSGYSAGLGYLSIIGPIKAGIMYGPGSREDNSNKFKGYVSIGYNF
jgi:hypothetical protein